MSNQWKLVNHVSIPGMILIEGPAFPLAVCVQATDITFPDYLRIMANARLIAAAPEMYELLERAGEIMNELESLIDNTFTNDASAQKSQWLKDADALLAKIEGGGE